MSLAIQKADFFKQDYAIRFAWYVAEAGLDVARRFQATLDPLPASHSAVGLRPLRRSTL